QKDVTKSRYLVGHNIEFDIKVTGAEFLRKQEPSDLLEREALDTKDVATDFCAIPGGKGGKFKWPTLTELHHKLFGAAFEDAHDAAYDVAATAKCFFGLIRQRILPPEIGVNPDEVIYEAPILDQANCVHTKDTQKSAAKDVITQARGREITVMAGPHFPHLNVHTQYSILQATSEIPSLIKKAKEFNMPAIAMTDYGNMMAASNFVKEAIAQGIKPV